MSAFTADAIAKAEPKIGPETCSGEDGNLMFWDITDTVSGAVFVSFCNNVLGTTFSTQTDANNYFNQSQNNVWTNYNFS